jgi:DNA-binding FadR family transcriptional regulator
MRHSADMSPKVTKTARTRSSEQSSGAESQRAYIELAKEILDSAEHDGIKVGDRLLSELELSRRFNVGRALVREAIVALQTSGYLESRAGSGIFLVRPASAGRSIGDLGPSLVEQLDARRLIEVELVAHAARVITRKEIDRLHDLVQQMVAALPRDLPELGAAFHIGLAKAARRPILAAAIEALFEMREGGMWTTLRKQWLRADVHAETVRCRQKIVAALRQGDAIAAQAAMTALISSAHALYFDSPIEPGQAMTSSGGADGENR